MDGLMRQPETPAGMMQVASSRAMQEVQAMVFVAKSFPRNEAQALEKILAECESYELAKKANYTYSKNTTDIEGPSIHLARVAAKHRGNINYGTVEVEQRVGESTMEAFAWDLETNTRRSQTFVAKHVRTKKDDRGGHTHTVLTDPRDIYEVTANAGSRRERSCIQAVTPKEVFTVALAACKEVVRIAEGGAPVSERVQAMMASFKSKYGVTPEQIEARLGHKVQTTTEAEFEMLRGIHNALSDEDQFATVESYFGTATVSPAAEKLKADVAAATVPDPAPLEPPPAKHPLEGADKYVVEYMDEMSLDDIAGVKGDAEAVRQAIKGGAE